MKDRPAEPYGMYAIAALCLGSLISCIGLLYFGFILIINMPRCGY